MNPTGIRMQCPECGWTCVMKSEEDVPDGVRIVHEGVPLCPNHTPGISMKPIASVDTTDRPRTGISAAMTLEQIAAKCVELNHEATDLANELKDAAEAHKAAKKAYDAKLVTLSLAVERLGRVMGGEQIQADLPLLAIAEDKPASESAVLDQAGGEAIRLAAEEVRHQLATHSIVVTVEDIEAWTLEQYDAAIAYLSGVEAVPDCGLPVPDFLPREVPDHVQALYVALRNLDVLVSLADVCGWSQAQRAAALTWAVEPEPSEPTGRSARPDFLPAPLGDEPEPARAVPLRRARKPGPVVTV